MTFRPDLPVGAVITREELMKKFGCSMFGGMRPSNKNNALVLISNHTEALYDDRRTDDGIFHYTGMGKTKDQSLDFRYNKTLYEAEKTGTQVFLFEVFKPNEYLYHGRVELADVPYQEDQLGEDDNMRKVWVFPLHCVEQESPIVIPEETLTNLAKAKEKKARKLPLDDLVKYARNARKGKGQRQTATITYYRSPHVAELAKRLANGVCQLCEKEGPFHDKDNKPYLETHHIEWLARGGEDSIENTVALCPNCHRMMHILDREKDRVKLKNKVQQLIEQANIVAP